MRMFPHCDRGTRSRLLTVTGWGATEVTPGPEHALSHDTLNRRQEKISSDGSVSSTGSMLTITPPPVFIPELCSVKSTCVLL